MPGKIKIRIFSARNLPIMDRSSDSSDAFVEVRLGANYDKTQVCKRSLDPNFNARFIFEVEEDEIQEEPLQIRVLDHDTYSSHDAIGKVYMDLKPLLNQNDAPSSISGWFPIFDTLHGIRGEVRVQVKVELFNDCNEYRKSSSGVQFFCSSKVPEGYVLQKFCGFVEELVVNDDPEYQWIDKIRAPRTSNEARQKLFSKLSGELQRRIGLKVLDIDANCVLGYLQNFDLEGEHGIVVRGIGTAAYIVKYNNQSTHSVNSSTTNTSNPVAQLSTSPNSQSTLLFKYSNTLSNNQNISNESSSLSVATNISTNMAYQTKEDNNSLENGSDKAYKKQHTQLNLNLNPIVSPTSQCSSGQPSTQTLNNPAQIKLNKASPSRALLRIHSDSDLNAYHHQQSTAPVTQIGQINSILAAQQAHASTIPQTPADCQPHKLCVLDKLEYPFLTIQQYPAGFIKSISGIVCARSVKLLSSSAIMEDVNTRDKWWIEIRNEIRSHMKALNCHVVLGYTETKSICEDVCVLSASGTAAVVDEAYFHDLCGSGSNRLADSVKSCQLCHVAYSENDLPFPIALCPCRICGLGMVPDIIFASIQPVPEIEIIGQGCLLRAIVTRPHKKCSGEISAKIISDYLPFMEYELHRQLVGKLKIKGMNMLYGLKFQISIGENLLIGLAEATACFAAALPPPVTPKIVSEKIEYTNHELKELDELSRLIDIKMKQNREFYNLNIDPAALLQQLNSSFNQTNNGTATNRTNASSIEQDNLLTTTSSPTINDPKALFKIELDDVRDKDGVLLLLDSPYKCKEGFYCCSTELMPGISKFNDNIQMFTSVYRCETSLVQMSTRRFNEICDEILQSLFYKFRKYPNCCLSNLSFDNSLYDDDHAMIIITGCCLTFDSNDSPARPLNSLENIKAKTQTITDTLNNNKQPFCKSANDVEITTLSYVPNATIEAYLGHINLFLIRESTQIKENGGLSGFMHCFISEMLALSRAHVLSMGGNALISFKMNECVLLDNPHRNQGQCLLNVAGDAVRFKKC